MVSPNTKMYAYADGYDPSGLIISGVGLIGGLMNAQTDAKKRRQMEERLSKMSLAQQKELEMRLQDVQGDVARMQILYQALAVDKNREALLEINKQKYLSFSIIGVGFVILAVVVVLVKKQ